VRSAWGPFGLDAAASKVNRKCPYFWGPESKTTDALIMTGRGYPEIADHEAIWINPPYHGLTAWLALGQWLGRYRRTIMLLPLGQWAAWFEIAKARAECVHIEGRIKFGAPEKKGRAAPMGMNFLAIFRPPVEGVTWPVGFTGASIKTN